jgi:hypothetical protein
MTLAFASATTATPAFADAEADAKDLFARGRDLRARGNCNEAVPVFRKAYALHPQGLGSLRNVAECEEQLGHFASSRRAWLDIKRALLTMEADPKYEGWDRDAEEAAERLRPKVATVTVDVIVRSPEGEGPATERSGVELLVNGESVGTTLVGTPLERDPGTYVFRAQAEHARPVETQVALAAGDQKRVTLRLVKTPPETTGPGEPVDTTKGRRTLGWVVLGAGGAALAASGVTFLLRQGAVSELEDQCPLYEIQPCSESLRGTVDRGKAMSLLTSVLFPVGLVGVGAGLALILTSPAPQAAAVKPGLTVNAGLSGASATWRF